MPADTSDIDKALMATLVNDATLAALMTDGVYADVAPQGKTAFTIVSQQDHADRYQQWERAFEDLVYLVKAVALGPSGSAPGANVKSAAARIDALLQDGSLGMITGYGLLAIERIERVRYTDVDDQSDRRWHHRGGLYRVMVQPT